MKIPEETSERDYARTNTKYYIKSRGSRRRRTALNPFSLLLLGCSLFLSSLVLAKASLFFFPLFFRRRTRFVLSYRVALHFEFLHKTSHTNNQRRKEKDGRRQPRDDDPDDDGKRRGKGGPSEIDQRSDRRLRPGRQRRQRQRKRRGQRSRRRKSADERARVRSVTDVEKWAKIYLFYVSNARFVQVVQE